MAGDGGPDPVVGRSFPRPPAYAWRWLQRSRPVVRAIADRLTGEPGGAEFVNELQRAFDRDAFTRTIVIDVIAEVAFNGRVPRRQPPGASWDRGLRWWAAALAGVSPEEYDAPRQVADQVGLFEAVGVDAPRHEVPAPPVAEDLVDAARRRAGRVSPERAALARSLRELLAASNGDTVPAAAIRQLIAELEDDPTA